MKAQTDDTSHFQICDESYSMIIIDDCENEHRTTVHVKAVSIDKRYVR